MGKKVCVICLKEKEGSPIEEDILLGILRKAKQKLGRSTGNELVVCSDCIPAYRKKRKNFEKWFGLYAGAGLLLIVVSLFVSQSLLVITYGVLLALFILSFSLLNYFPKAKIPEEKKV